MSLNKIIGIQEGDLVRLSTTGLDRYHNAHKDRAQWLGATFVFEITKIVRYDSLDSYFAAQREPFVRYRVRAVRFNGREVHQGDDWGVEWAESDLELI